MDSIVMINQGNNTIVQASKTTKMKYVKQLGRLCFSPIIQVYNKNVSYDTDLIIL